MSILCFNPRARGGRDLACRWYRPRGDVSIHAPAGGATPEYEPLIERIKVSIHAPAGGATGNNLSSLMRSVMFQSTRPRGARRSLSWVGTIHVVFQSTRPRGARRLGTYQNSRFLCVSIHAPAGGATALLVAIVNKVFKVSIHAPAGGATDDFGIFLIGLIESFNPRARGGRDGMIAPASSIVRLKFQSTRPRGARPRLRLHESAPCSVSIHAPAGGAT